MLPKVNVIGNAVYDVKDPYNEDQVLPNATAGTMTEYLQTHLCLTAKEVAHYVQETCQVSYSDSKYYETFSK